MAKKLEKTLFTISMAFPLRFSSGAGTPILLRESEGLQFTVCFIDALSALVAQIFFLTVSL
jgi:hypothetical protein